MRALANTWGIMNNYISQTEFAAKSLIDLISSDFDALEHTNEALKSATAKFNVNHQIFMANEFHTAANYYHAQMAKAHEPQAHIITEIERLSGDIDAKSASISALSGALLQIAKQGISLTFGRPENAPNGEEINGLLVKEIIWEARNQSIHYENPKEVSEKVVNLFKKIDTVRNDGAFWAPRNQINYAFDVVRFLGWLNYEQYEIHLKSIKRK